MAETIERQDPTPLAKTSPALSGKSFRVYRANILRRLAKVYGEQAGDREDSLRTNAYYYRRLGGLLRLLTEEGKRVLSIRSDVGQFLEDVRPAYGVGLEIAPELVELSRRLRPQYEFMLGNPEDTSFDETFDYVLVVNAVNDQFDIQAMLKNLHSACRPETRVVLTFNNWLWQPVLSAAQALV